MPHPITLSHQMRQALTKAEAQHKYDHGHALILSGGPGKGGAARLAARAALRVGAGLVTLACPPRALDENAAQLTAVMLTALPDSFSLRGLLQDRRLTALLLGPGLGLARAQEMVPAALWAARPTVLDADALTAFADDPGHLFTLLHPDVVLTPHLGEFARLFPDLAAPLPGAVLEARVAATAAAADRAGCTVLLKGAQTVIAAPGADPAVHDATGARAVPWLATAGSGDVLAGLIAGLLTRGLPSVAAASTATWLHAEAARRFGPGLIAEDLPEQIPGLFRDLGL